MRKAKKIFEEALERLDNEGMKEIIKEIGKRGKYKNELAKKYRDELYRCFEEELFTEKTIKEDKDTYILVTIDSKCKHLPVPFYIDWDLVFFQDYHGSPVSLPKK